MSNQLPTCEVCGARLPANALGEPCPACLVRSAIGPPADPSSHLDAGQGTIRRFGDYELLEEIARGGMGAVFRARQLSLKRLVAVKVLLAAEFANETSRQRFRREAESVASLNHPNIVSIYEVGEQEGQPYFSMELIEGCSLAEVTREKPLPARQAAQWLKTIAEAVHYAHQRGVLHRDLKPSNVLVDNADVPHVTDFGLAKLVEPGQDLTLTGQVLGTPSYMSPEQADPKRGETTAASDVYSLGAILYHLLTARPPFMAETLTQTLRLVVEGEAVSPRLLNPSVPRDLETICVKCLSKERQLRYSTAQELADELGRFLSNEPIRARPITPVARLARWCRRKPALATALGAVAMMMLVVAIGSPIAIIRINRAQRQTKRELYTALLEQARATARSGEMGQRVRALEAVRQAAAITNSPELRREAMAALALPDLRFERELPTGSQFTMVKLDPLLERIAQCQGDGPVEIRSATDGKRLTILPASTSGICYFGKWSPNAQFLAVTREAPGTASLEVWEVASGRRVLLAQDGAYREVAFHPGLPRLMGGKQDGTLVLWDLENQKEISRFVLPASARTWLGGGALTFSPDAERFAAAYVGVSTNLVSVHRSADGSLLVSTPFTNLVTDLDWHPSGTWIVATDLGGFVHMLDSQTGQDRILGRHKAQAATAVFSPDGGYLFTGGWERELTCWDARTMERAFLIALNSFRVQFRAGGAQCALLTKSACQIHSFERPVAHREMSEGLRGHVRHAAFSPDGKWLAVADLERMGVWDLAGRGPGALSSRGANSRIFFLAPGELCTDHAYRCQVLPREKASAPPLLRELQWPVAEEEVITSLCPAASNVVALTSSHGSRLVSLDNTAFGGSRWLPTADGINGASPDGRWLGIFYSTHSVLHVYRLPGLEAVANLTNQAGIGSFDFSPQGDQVAVSTPDLVEIWSTTTWQRTSALTNFQALFFAPREHAWWLTSDFRSGGLYDSRTREPLLPLPTGMLPLAVSPDGRFLAVSVEGRRLQVWDLIEVRRKFRELGIDWQSD